MNCPKNGPGVTHALDNQKTYSPTKAGVLLVWENPADGKIYVINGRHRHRLALRTGQPHVLVMKINAPTAQEARVIGAETNISESHGSTLDAARYFKSAKIRTRQDALSRGLPLSQPKVMDGLAMARLRGEILDRVERGEIPEGRAVAIGGASEDTSHHEAALRAIARMERQGKKVTHGQAESIARQIAEAGTRAEPRQDQAGLQGEHPFLGEQSEIDDYVVRQIRKGPDKHALGAAKAHKEGLGHTERETIIRANNAGVFGEQSEPEQLYFRLINKTGPLNDIRGNAARRLAGGQEPPLRIKGEAYYRIRRELQKQLGAGRERSARPQK